MQEKLSMEHEREEYSSQFSLQNIPQRGANFPLKSRNLLGIAADEKDFCYLKQTVEVWQENSFVISMKNVVVCTTAIAVERKSKGK